MDLSKKKDYFLTQYGVTGFYNRGAVCLLRGTNSLEI